MNSVAGIKFLHCFHTDQNIFFKNKGYDVNISYISSYFLQLRTNALPEEKSHDFLLLLSPPTKLCS